MSSTTPSRAWVRLALILSAALLLCALGTFYYASRSMQARNHGEAGQVTVTIQAHACEPDTLSLPAGKASFRIVNASRRAVEWEILDGVMVVAERENIAPGLSDVINVQLDPGDYVITCGLLSNPRGSLRVTPTLASERAAAAPPQLREFLGPLSEVRVDLSRQLRSLDHQLDALREALAANDLPRAQAAYRDAHAGYHRLLPLAQYVAELDNRMNAPAAYYEQREQDPAFSGFHRIEYGLFEQHSADGLEPVLDGLQADAKGLRKQLLALKVSPEQLLNGAGRLLQQMAEQRVDGGTAPYAHDQLSSFDADQAAVARISELLRPVLEHSYAAAVQTVDGARDAFTQALQAASDGDPQRSYAQVTAEQRAALAQAARRYGEALTALAQALHGGTSQ